MLKIQKHIEIVCSTTPGLSSMSKESREAILGVLSQHYHKPRITIINNLADLEALASRQPDLVFLGMKFIPQNPVLGFNDANKIWISQYLDANNITYTGSSWLAHELELNKPLAKQRVLDAGLMTSQFYVSPKAYVPTEEDISLTYPLFIKPANRGGGLGVDANSVVNNFAELTKKVKSIANNHRADSLIEQYLDGREFSVAILKHENSAQFSVMPIELVAPAEVSGIRVLSETVKSSNAEQVSEVSDEAAKSKVCDLAINIFHALGARDYGRIDIRMDKSGQPHFLEANLLPSLISGYGSFPKACELNQSLGYEDMILSIIRLAFQRDIIEADEPIGFLPIPVPA